MGLTASKNNPYIFSGINDNGTPSTVHIHTIHINLYVDDFVLFSELDAEETCFKEILNDQVTTDFMSDPNFSLESSFEWTRRPDGNLSVHFSQQAFTRHTAT